MAARIRQPRLIELPANPETGTPMTDPAQALDDGLTWWDREKFKVGFFAGFVSAIFVVWLGS